MPRSLVFTIALTALATGCADGVIATGDTQAMDSRPWVERSAPLDTGALVLDTDTTHATFSLFGETFEAELDGVSKRPGSITWRGTTRSGGAVTLTQVGGVLTGTVRTADELFRLMPSAGGTLVEQTEEAAMPPDPEPIPGYTPELDLLPPVLQTATSTIDVLVAYTTQSRIAAGSKDAVEATIQLAVAETNEGWTDSGLRMRLNLVGMREVSGVETEGEWANRLDQLREDGDGFFDEVHATRDELGADEVVLLVEDDSACGIAYVMTDPGPAFESSAFATVSRSCATGYYSFGHEIGHNLGSAHHASFGEEGATDWAFGHRDPDGAFRTVMAYNCSGGCTRINRWSDPAATYDGAALGAAHSSDEPADNLDVLGDTRSVVAAFRTSAEVAEPTANLVSPSGSTVSGGVAELTWDVETSVRVTVGATPGSGDYVDIDVTGGSTLITGLPVDGSAVWISLTTDAGRTDTRFVTEPATEVALVTPNTTLNRARQEFVWTDDASPRFRFSVGTSEGAADVVDIISDDPRVVTRSLPTVPLWVRIGSEVEGEWVYETHTY